MALKFREKNVQATLLNVEKNFQLAGTEVTSTAAELNIMDGVTSTAAELNYNDGVTPGTVLASKTLMVGASRELATLGALTGDGKLSYQATIAAGASVGHIIKQTNAAGGSYSGSNFGLIIKNYDADNTVVHNGGENGALGVWAKFASAPTAGGENVICSFHQHSSSAVNPKHGVVIYGDPTNGLSISGGTSTYGISVVNQTLTNLVEMAAGAEARVASTYCDTSNQTSDGAIRVTVGGTEYFIPLFTAGNTSNSW